MTSDALDEKSAIVLAGVHRLGEVRGYPVTDASLVAETDLDIDEVRQLLWGRLAETHLDVVPGDHEGSTMVVGPREG